jgi:uncharacterized membrane protein YkvA (DUF1232 family)
MSPGGRTRAGSVGVEIELNPPGRRLYDRLRATIRRPLPGGSSDLRDVVLLLPDLTALLVRLLRDPRVKAGDKALALFGVGYVLSPVDLLPGFLFGPVGVVDDLFVVSATLSRLVNHVHPDVVRSHWSGQGDALETIQRVTEWSERQVVGRVRALVRSVLGR